MTYQIKSPRVAELCAKLREAIRSRLHKDIETLKRQLSEALNYPEEKAYLEKTGMGAQMTISSVNVAHHG